MDRDLVQRVLAALYQAESAISGQELAQQLGVSRTAVWKAIGKLRAAGYEIDATPNRGYQLRSQIDIPYPAEVSRGLKTKQLGREVHYYETLASTNEQLRVLAREGAEEGTVVIADSQLKGKGRWGRSWFASPGQNLTFSILLRPDIEPRRAGLLAPLVGVACHKVLTGEPYNIPCSLKWPNDLVAAGRKLGGILIELSAELERIHYVIVGIGLNVNDTFRDAPEEVQKRATSIAQFTGRVRRVPLLQRLLAALEQEYQLFLAEGPEKLLAHYRTFCATVGQQVSVYSRGELVAAGLAEDIDSGGNLLVRSKEGSLTPVTSGEVSLRQE